MLKGLIVSCQAGEGEPLFGHNVMGLMAKAAVEGGANGIRASSVTDILEIKKQVNVPVVGLIKKCYPNCSVYITPTIEELKQLIDTGCEVIAIDATNRARPNNVRLEDMIAYAKGYAKNVLLMADIATVEEAILAERLGFDIISTTMRGYTSQTKGTKIPDYQMIKELKRKVKKPIVAEGGIWEVGQLKKILKLGVSAVVIGTAITRPKDITARFKSAF